ncbi:Sorbitol dehydrogenase [bacterium HR17]|uniref:Sorbitol dehydrogenase n=1 Tax=Candidatus Fervidibacter japonicus TaxID=2035412 RepID=A0A2H5XFB0_9BACT|nr:Sorbitol dehydrogenase [bacterium HR17]
MRGVQLRKSVWRYLTVRMLGRRLPTVCTSPLGLLALREMPPLRLPSPNWVRLRPRLSGICGSDLAVITAKSSLLLSPVTSVPFTFGHEIVADVVEVGAAVTRVQVGDRVVVEPALSCFVRELHPPCPQCAEGNYACCERLTDGVIGAGVQTGYCRDTGGGWGDELVAHEWQLFRVPAALRDEEAVLVEPFSCALHAVLRALAVAEAPKMALVVGCGTIGLLTIAALRAVERATGRTPLRLFAVAKYPHQQEWAQRLGADTVVPAGRGCYRALQNLTGARLFYPEQGKPTVLGGVDIVFDCVGSQSSLDDAVRWTRAQGVVVVVGMPAEPKVSWASLWFKELRVLGAYAYGVERWSGERVRTFDIALTLLRQGAVNLQGLVTHRFPLEQWQRAVQTALQAGHTGAVKVTLTP